MDSFFDANHLVSIQNHVIWLTDLTGTTNLLDLIDIYLALLGKMARMPLVIFYVFHLPMHLVYDDTVNANILNGQFAFYLYREQVYSNSGLPEREKGYWAR